MAGIPMGMMALLGRKYDILQQQANADMLRARAAAGLDTTKAGLMPAESRANIDLSEAQRGFTRANIGLSNARTAQTVEDTKYIGPLANANIAESRSRGRLYGSQADSEDIMNRWTPFTFRGMGDGLGRINSMMRDLPLRGLGFNFDFDK